MKIHDCYVLIHKTLLIILRWSSSCLTWSLVVDLRWREIWRNTRPSAGVIWVTYYNNHLSFIMELGRRLAVERDLEKHEAFSRCNLGNVLFTWSSVSDSRWREIWRNMRHSAGVIWVMYSSHGVRSATCGGESWRNMKLSAGVIRVIYSSQLG